MHKYIYRSTSHQQLRTSRKTSESPCWKMHETRWEFCPPKVAFEPSFCQHFWFFISATGEPALLMGISVLFAIWDALNSYKVDAGQTGWWQLSKLQNSCVSHFKRKPNFRRSGDCGTHSPACRGHSWSVHFLRKESCQIVWTKILWLLENTK